MKKRRLLSLVMTVVMALSLMSSLFAVNLSAATDPKAIDKVIVDFRNERAYKQNGSVYVHKPTETEPDPNTGGLYEFNEEMQAMQVLYSKAQRDKYSDIRLMSKVQGLSEKYKFWVLVYATKTDKPYDIYLHNTPAQGVKAYVAKDAKSTDGKFVVSEPLDITLVENKKSILQRWIEGNINTVNFVSEDTNAGFYIKEMGFFTSAEDAKAYYSQVDLSKPSSEYSNKPVSNIPADEEAYITPFVTTEVDEPKATVKPYILKLTTKLEMVGQYADFYKHGDNLTEGIYEFVDENGDKSLKLTYAEPTQTKYPQYRVMIKTPKNQLLTKDHKYMRVTYKTNTDQLSEFVLINNGDRTLMPILASNAAISKGEWTRTNATPIEEGGFLDRFLTDRHCTFGFFCPSKEESFYIKEIAFFASPAQAYEYYGDKPDVTSITYNRMSFGPDGTGTTLDGDTYGVHAFNEKTGALDITYAEKTNVPGASYMAKIKFKPQSDYQSNLRYMRVLYSADNPDGISHASMYLRTDAQNNVFLLKENIEDTDGKFVLSDVACLSTVATDRFSGTGTYSSKIHNSLIVNCSKPGGTYSVKAVYFFGSRDEAEAFTISDKPADVNINGVDIEKYRIVVSADAEKHAMTAAGMINDRLYEIAGLTLDIVTDETPETDYEIVIGRTDREIFDMTPYMDEIKGELFQSYAVEIKGHKVYLVSQLPTTLNNAAYDFNRIALYGSMLTVPEKIDIKDQKLVSSHTGVRASTQFEEFKNVADPFVFTDDMDTDDGYWQEENNASNWQFKDGVYTVKATDGEYSYLHVYEPNVEFTAKVKFSGNTKDSDIALMLRQNSADAWVKAGYDFSEGVWYVDSREGADFYRLRLVSVKADVKPDTWYELKLTADGEKVSLYVDGNLVGEADGATHDTPGKITFFAENITASFDDAKAVLLSGEGTIMKNTYHTYLMPDKFVAGGTVLEMLDGTLYYTYSNGVNMKSTDKGLTWEYCDKLFDHLGTQPNIIRLLSGELIRMGKVDSNVVFFISEDDGATWKQTGTVCETPFRGDKEMNATAVNMNDKLTQMPSTGRIFYSQNYESKDSYFDHGNGVKKKVFCEFYYSDDKGYTWTKSETDSWEIEGNEKETHFGECKIIECADGTLRMYNSWNKYGCVVYSESKDNGVTWGPITKIPEIKCSLSSMQFVRDPYAENDYTYYMVNVYSVETSTATMPRSRLSLMRTTDGKNWVYLGDLWRWESNYYATDNSSLINHIVNPFIYVTKDYIYCGSGTSEQMADDYATSYHQLQRQNIWTVDKSTLGEGVALNIFDDVKLGTPEYAAVSFVTSEGLFNGMSGTYFAPEVTMNRSMFVTVLGRLDKADVSAYVNPTFSDVKAGQWYTSYVEWAAANGIVNGMGNGTYGINGAVTVEQALTILYRYNGGKTSDKLEGASLSDFSDSAKVSSWASEAMKWAVENGIYAGQNGSLNPTSAANRGLVAMMFANYVKAFG